jgi:hypothetical protein
VYQANQCPEEVITSRDLARHYLGFFSKPLHVHSSCWYQHALKRAACCCRAHAEHQIDDLEFELHQGLLEDFNTEIEDGSTMQVQLLNTFE